MLDAVILLALVLVVAAVMACLWGALALERGAWLAALVFCVLANVASWHAVVLISLLIGG